MRALGALLGSTILGLSLAPLAAARAEPSSTYNLAQVTPVSGEGSWDYLTFDQTHQRLFVSRVGGVSVFSAKTNTPVLVGNIPGVAGNLVNRAVLVEGQNFGFTSNGTGNSTTIFTLSNLKVAAHVELGEETDAATYDPATANAVFFSDTGQEALIFSLATRKIVGRVPLGTAPEFAAGDNNGTVYVNLPATGMVDRIDVRTRRVVASYAVDPSCQGNMSMDIDRNDHLLFVGCANGVLDVMNYDTGKIVNTFPVGPVPDAVSYDPTTGALFAASVNGKITSIEVENATDQSLLQTITSQPAAHTLVVDPASHRVFSDTADIETAVVGADGHPLVIGGTFRLLTFTP